MDCKYYAIFDQSGDTKLSLEKSSTISDICSFGNLLFLGTHDGLVLQIVFEEIEDQETCYSFSVIFIRRISETSILAVKASQFAEFVAVLSGTKLQFFDAEKLECSHLRPNFDGVSAFSVSDSSLSVEQHSILAVCNLNHVLQVYRVLTSRMDLVNSINLPSIALAVRCLDCFAIVATKSRYLSVNLKTKTCHDIFDRSSSRDQYLIEPVAKDEFLLSGPGSLGIFVNANGQSERPPLTLSTNLLGLFVREELVFAVDDEFVSIHCANQQKQVQTLVVKNVCATCMSLDRNLLFVVSRNSTDGQIIRVIRPETWDLEAKRYILAGRISDASDLVDIEYAKLLDLCNFRPATSGGARNIFNLRSKRVYALMGFHFFETGQLTQCRGFFEKSSLDVRELLSRYIDLLPRGYTFATDRYLRITETVNADESPPLLNIFDLSKNLGISVTEFRKFLLKFLLENRRGRIFANHTQFVETAILKLYVLLTEGDSFFCCGDHRGWEEVINSLSNADVGDLLVFLEEHRAHHVKALLYRWNGNLESALDIWKSLAFETLSDVQFPGRHFYAKALLMALTSPFAYRGQSSSSSSPNNHAFPVDMIIPESTVPKTASIIYADLISHHLQALLDVNMDPEREWAMEIANSLLDGIACITTWTDVGTTLPAPINTKASAFVFAPASILKRLLPQHCELAERFLWHRIFKAGDKEPSRHTLLAELQMNLLLKYVEANEVERLVRQRLRFQSTLSKLNDCHTEQLLKTLESSPSASLFTDEHVTLLGKLKKYREALEIFLLKKRDLNGALRFCAWCTNLDIQEKLIEQSSLWGMNNNACKTSSTPDAFTTLLKLLLCSSDPYLLEQSIELLKINIPSLDFAEICRTLPDDWHISDTLSAFLIRGLKSTLMRVSKSNLEFGLTTRLAVNSRAAAAVSMSQVLHLTEDFVCSYCHFPLNAYGQHRPFAWILSDNQPTPCVVHLHCLQSDSKL